MRCCGCKLTAERDLAAVAAHGNAAEQPDEPRGARAADREPDRAGRVDAQVEALPAVLPARVREQLEHDPPRLPGPRVRPPECGGGAGACAGRVWPARFGGGVRGRRVRRREGGQGEAEGGCQLPCVCVCERVHAARDARPAAHAAAAVPRPEHGAHARRRAAPRQDRRLHRAPRHDPPRRRARHDQELRHGARNPPLAARARGRARQAAHRRRDGARRRRPAVRPRAPHGAGGIRHGRDGAAPGHAPVPRRGQEARAGPGAAHDVCGDFAAAGDE